MEKSTTAGTDVDDSSNAEDFVENELFPANAQQTLAVMNDDNDNKKTKKKLTDEKTLANSQKTLTVMIDDNDDDNGNKKTQKKMTGETKEATAEPDAGRGFDSTYAGIEEIDKTLAQNTKKSCYSENTNTVQTNSASCDGNTSAEETSNAGDPIGQMIESMREGVHIDSIPRHPRPGAVAVAGPGISSEETKDDDEWENCEALLNTISPAENIDQRAYSAFVVNSVNPTRIYAKVTRRHTPRLHEDTPVFDGVTVRDTPPECSSSSTDLSKNTKKYQCFVIITIALGIIAAVSVAIALPLSKSKGKNTPPSPPSVPSAPPPSNRFRSISATLGLDNVVDESTPQYKALAWLADEDTAYISVYDVENLTDRYALAAIYFGTGGDSTWLDQLNFLSSDNICAWNADVPNYASIYYFFDGLYEFNYHYHMFRIGYKGVFCDEKTGVINGIDFAQNNITGVLPEEIGMLQKLTHLSLWQNNLHGSIPSAFYSLRLLENVGLIENKLTGTLSSKIGNLVNLRTLALVKNNLNGSIPESVGELFKLSRLSLSLNEFTGTIPTSINMLSNLQLLQLEKNLLTGPLPFEEGSMPKLEILPLDGNNLKGTVPEAIFTYTNITHLMLEGNSLTGTISQNISKLANLVWLSLEENNLNGTIPSSIGGNTKLSLLRLNNNNLSGTLPETLGNLRDLKRLRVHENNLNGTIPMTLEGISFIEAEFFGNSLSGSLEHICTNNTHHIFIADCYGDNPEVNCSWDCCHVCCDDIEGCYGFNGCKFDPKTFQCH